MIILDILESVKMHAVELATIFLLLAATVCGYAEWVDKDGSRVRRSLVAGIYGATAMGYVYLALAIHDYRLDLTAWAYRSMYFGTQEPWSEFGVWNLVLAIALALVTLAFGIARIRNFQVAGYASDVVVIGLATVVALSTSIMAGVGDISKLQSARDITWNVVGVAVATLVIADLSRAFKRPQRGNIAFIA